MQINLKKIITLAILAGALSACASSGSKTQQAASQEGFQQNKNKSNDLVDGNTAEYTLPNDTQKKANYKKATQLYAELAITYASEGYLDMAKDRLIRAQDLQKEHGYNLAIVGYAAGYYYQAIGVNSVAEKYYKDTADDHSKDFEAINFYAQFLCKEKGDYEQAEKLFDKSLYLSNNDDMAQTLFLYSECVYKQGKKDQALKLMQRASKFRTNYRSAELRIAEMYFERKEYKKCYKIIYGMKDDKQFFYNKQVLELRLKLAEYANNKDEIAIIKLILSSSDYNNNDMNQFFSKADMGDINNEQVK
ncbi:MULTISPECIES: tetratricopeptide repeat protein [unclassified Francisella]|uniref:tetratricopeptide repeat protein n=1 Tax=unclassified Francisella TaxID=2610885 RepID=UPI002E321B0E|nr:MULTISPECIES: tetratricopeptide repeat protein [unclassified Francisella]MED7819813.1 tetratricopeptide repeat protein [Francisella sp. 19S2-4]MED7830633.1 tetratricopeptide repeat protein [Francisella sp. 19S2-10]